MSSRKLSNTLVGSPPPSANNRPHPTRAVGIGVILPRKEVIPMAVKWNALRVIEAVDAAEKHIKAIAEPLKCAEDVIKEASQIPNLPQYIESRFRSLIDQIQETRPRLKTKLDAIRGDVPKEAVELDKRIEAQGERLTML